jgi:hypothetical protein
MTTELSGLLPVKERLDSEHPGHCGAQDTFYVAKLKGMGRVSNAINVELTFPRLPLSGHIADVTESTRLTPSRPSVAVPE